MRVFTKVLAVLAGTALAAGAASVAQAQSYPQPTGNCSLVLGNVNPPLNSTIDVTLLWGTTAGSPVAGMPVTISFTPPAGSNASVTVPPGLTTGSDGTASFKLFTGNVVGRISLAANCAVTVAGAVSGATPPSLVPPSVAPPGPAAQVQVPVGAPPLPPRTGTGGTASEALGPAAVAMLTTLLLASGVLFGLRWLREGRR